MADNKPQPATTPEVPTDLDLLGDSENYDPEAGTPVAPQIQKFVDTAHDAWLLDKDAWRTTPPLSNIAAAREIVDEARRYGSKVREIPVTLQVRGYENETDGKVRVVYRVRDKVQSGRKPNSTPPGLRSN